MKTFKEYVKENMTSGGATSVFGTLQPNPTPQFSSDFYATGDARVPKVIGIGSKSKKKKVKKNIIPVVKRSIYMGM